MNILDKLSNLIFEEESTSSPKKQEKTKKKGRLSDLFFEEEDTTVATYTKPRKRLSDLFFEDEPEPDDGIKSTLFDENELDTSETNISTKIAQRESELMKLGTYFQTVNPKEFTDCKPEYEAYISLIDQLKDLKELSSSANAAGSLISFQLESALKKFEADYNTHIGAIQSLCYLNELSTNNAELEKLFSKDFTPETINRIIQLDKYISSISEKRKNFDRKYSSRLYDELKESEYRLTILKLMIQLSKDEAPRRNPFASFTTDKKIIFETFLSKDIMLANQKYNTLANNKRKYVKYGFVDNGFFQNLDSVAETIAQNINTYTIDDFKLSELLENGDGYETLKQFLAFKLDLNYLDSYTKDADQCLLDEEHRKAVRNTLARPTTTTRKPKSGKKTFPDFDDDL